MDTINFKFQDNEILYASQLNTLVDAINQLILNLTSSEPPVSYEFKYEVYIPGQGLQLNDVLYPDTNWFTEYEVVRIVTYKDGQSTAVSERVLNRNEYNKYLGSYFNYSVTKREIECKYGITAIRASDSRDEDSGYTYLVGGNWFPISESSVGVYTITSTNGGTNLENVPTLFDIYSNPNLFKDVQIRVDDHYGHPEYVLEKAIRYTATILYSIPGQLDVVRTASKYLDMTVEPESVLSNAVFVVRGKTWDEFIENPQKFIDEAVANEQDPRVKAACAEFNKNTATTYLYEGVQDPEQFSALTKTDAVADVFDTLMNMFRLWVCFKINQMLTDSSRKITMSDILLLANSTSNLDDPRFFFDRNKEFEFKDSRNFYSYKQYYFPTQDAGFEVDQWGNVIKDNVGNPIRKIDTSRTALGVEGTGYGFGELDEVIAMWPEKYLLTLGRRASLFNSNWEVTYQNNLKQSGAADLSRLSKFYIAGAPYTHYDSFVRRYAKGPLFEGNKYHQVLLENGKIETYDYTNSYGERNGEIRLNTGDILVSLRKKDPIMNAQVQFNCACAKFPTMNKYRSITAILMNETNELDAMNVTNYTTTEPIYTIPYELTVTAPDGTTYGRHGGNDYFILCFQVGTSVALMSCGFEDSIPLYP